MPTDSLLIGYSEVMGFGHTLERVQQIEPEIRAFVEDMAMLWEVDVEDSGMAVSFSPEGLSW
jgi:hypothetical protein